MSRNLGSSGLYDESLIDDRNERPLTIAFAKRALREQVADRLRDPWQSVREIRAVSAP